VWSGRRVAQRPGNDQYQGSHRGVGGSHYLCDHEFNMLEKALQCDAIDVISIHGYMSKTSDWAYYVTGDRKVLTPARAAGKNVMIEEWGVSTTFDDTFRTQVKVFNNAGVPWVRVHLVETKRNANMIWSRIGKSFPA
jgi:mannan endo-1,4-beta-mannosidase